MTEEEKEIKRHEKYQKALAGATTISTLPSKITPNKLKKVLCQELNFGVEPIDEIGIDSLKNEIVTALILDENYINSDSFKADLDHELRYSGVSTEGIKSRTEYTFTSRRLHNYIKDIRDYDKKFRELSKPNALARHNIVMEQIRKADSTKKLPKINNSNLTILLINALKPAFRGKLSTNDVKLLAEKLIEGYSFDDEKVLLLLEAKFWNNSNLVYPFFAKGYDVRRKFVLGLLEKDFNLRLLIEELRAKNARTLEIYKEEHERIMASIGRANRISEMPTGFSLSRITGYLSGNSIITKNDKTMPGEWFNNLALLLLNGASLDTPEVQAEINNISLKYCLAIRESESSDIANINASVYQVLYYKIAKLPKLAYYVEEVRYASKRQEEFISRESQSVKVYILPSDKSPIDGGNFYCIYISRKEGPKLNIEEIFTKAGEVKDIEKYIKENYDPTFKRAGGIILNRDEKIDRNVSVYAPDDGSIGISPEDSENYKKLEDLTARLNVLYNAKTQATEAFEKQQEEFNKQYAEYKQQQEKSNKEIGEIQGEMNTLVKTLKAKDKKEDNKEEEK